MSLEEIDEKFKQLAQVVRRVYRLQQWVMGGRRHDK